MKYFVFKMQLSVPKESEIGFKITELQNEVIAIVYDRFIRSGIATDKFYSQGIFVDDVYHTSAASRLLKKMDKILDIDGVDFTNISLKEASTVLSNSGPILNIMISRI